MALGLVKTNRIVFFALKVSGFQQLMIVNFVKTIVFVHLKSWELFVLSNLIIICSVKFDQRYEINIL